jgi:phospholipid/cholesterol/gamma-HCH transport system substrate-binding protein
MSATTRRTVFVGLFVFLATIIFAGAILAVGTLQNAFSPKITTHAVFEEVGGLQSGDFVWSSGMRVGVIESLTFIEASKVDVVMRINESVVPFIPADSKATIGSDGLIGNPIVVLAEGTPGGPSIQEGGEFGIGDAVSTAQIMETLQENNENLVAITGDIKELTRRLRDGEGALGKLLKEDDLYDEAKDAIVEAKAAVVDIQAASANARQLTASLAKFSAELNQPGQLPHDLANDTELMPSVRAAVSDLEDIVAKASDVVDGLAADVGDDSTPLGVLMSDTESGADLKEILANLEETTVLLNEDLVAIRSNFLFRPYFKKQEREAKKAAKANGQ